MKKQIMALLLTIVLALGLTAPAQAYTVMPGDSLWRIATNELGDGARWGEIYEANKGSIKDPRIIFKGQELTLPGQNSATATAAGYEETVTVTVTMDSGKITAVNATSTSSSDIGRKALEAMPQAMVARNSVNIDAIAGATGTSKAILSAAQQASAQLSGADGQLSQAELEAWAVANGYVKAEDYNIVTGVDAITSATQTGVGGVNYGPIEWSKELQTAAIKEFLKGGTYLGSPDFAQDGTGHNYREMYQMATSFNNRPSNANLELVLNVDSMNLVGLSEAGTGKINEFQRNPYVSVSWCRQLREENEEAGYNYFNSYGIQFNGKVRVYTTDDLATEAGQDAAIELFDTYYPTIASNWGAYAAVFKDLTDPAEIRTAKLGYITKTLSGGAYVAYEIVPESIVITAPVLINLIPQMANAVRFTTAQEGEDKYDYDLYLSDEFLDALVKYKADFVSTEEGKTLVENYYTSNPMFQMLDPLCAQYGMPTSLQAALAPTSAAGMKTQTIWIP